MLIDGTRHNELVKLNLNFAQKPDLVMLIRLVHLFLIKQLGGNVEDSIVDGLDLVVFGAKLL